MHDYDRAYDLPDNPDDTSDTLTKVCKELGITVIHMVEHEEKGTATLCIERPEDYRDSN